MAWEAQEGADASQVLLPVQCSFALLRNCQGGGAIAPCCMAFVEVHIVCTSFPSCGAFKYVSRWVAAGMPIQSLTKGSAAAAAEEACVLHAEIWLTCSRSQTRSCESGISDQFLCQMQ